VARETAGKGWPVTVSIGAVTFLRPAWDVDLMVQRVDAQMYAAKRKGKARIEHAVVCEAQDATTAGEPSRERRATARVVCNQPAAVHPEADGRGAFATIRDLSVGGVGLLLGEQYPLGTVLVVEPMTRGARTLLARVVRSAPVEGGWFHGCELSTRLEEDELRRWLENRPAKTV